MSNKSNANVTTMGIDIGKNSFHVVGLDLSDGAIQRGRLIYSATASAKIALACGVCEYQSVKRKT